MMPTGKILCEDIEDPTNYHIVINTYRTGLEGAAKIIHCAVMSKFQSKFAKN